MSRVLVTGGRGMIGESIRRRENFDSWDIQEGQDVCSVGVLNEQYDGIIHLAAKSRVVDGFYEPVETWTTNTIGTIQVLEKAKKDNCWVLNGSSFTAGKSSNVYSYSKVAGEELCKIYARSYGVKCISVQFSTVYGSELDLPKRFIPSVASRLVSGNPVLYLEDENARLSPTYIEDVADVLLNLIRSDKSDWLGQVYSIISKEGFFTTGQLVRKMCVLTDKHPELVWGKKRVWDKRARTDADSALLTDTSFDEGFLRYYEELIAR